VRMFQPEGMPPRKKIEIEGGPHGGGRGG
jgi:hypothetical protein